MNEGRNSLLLSATGIRPVGWFPAWTHASLRGLFRSLHIAVDRDLDGNPNCSFLFSCRGRKSRGRRRCHFHRFGCLIL
jgi:hypothetical protein